MGKIFSVSVMGSRQVARNYQDTTVYTANKHIVVEDKSKKAAQKYAEEKFRELYPEKDGWGELTTSVIEVDEVFLSIAGYVQRLR